MKAYRVNLLKWTLSVALLLVWASVALATFLQPLFANQSYSPGGDHGMYISRSIGNLVGAPCLTALLIIIAVAFLTYFSAATVIFIRKMLNPAIYYNKVKFTVNRPGETEPENEEPVNEEQPVDEQVITTPPTKVFEPAASAKKNPEPKAEKKLCANCGAELEEDCLFCTECGTPVTASVPKEDEADAADNVRFCVECGFKVTDPEAVFCNSCGARLQPVGSEKTVKSDPQVKRCPNCGFNTTDPEVMFCIECGTKLP